jgi:hypothetical protein
VASYFIGLDLGQTTDFTALTVLERSARAGEETIYLLRHLQRFHLGTSYTSIIELVAKILGTAPLVGCSTLVIDQTGVGRPVVDMFRRSAIRALVIPITITGGHTVSLAQDASYHVPKKDLVSSLRLLLENGRLKIARKLPGVDVLVRELLNFQVKITASANETFGAWRQGSHDDLVLALALSAWVAEKQIGPNTGPLVCWPRKESVDLAEDKVACIQRIVRERMLEEDEPDRQWWQ